MTCATGSPRYGRTNSVSCGDIEKGRSSLLDTARAAHRRQEERQANARIQRLLDRSGGSGANALDRHDPGGRRGGVPHCGLVRLSVGRHACKAVFSVFVRVRNPFFNIELHLILPPAFHALSTHLTRIKGKMPYP